MGKRIVKEKQIQDNSCAALEKRLEKMEKAFKALTGVGIEEYGNPDSDPVVEEKRFAKTVLRIHKSGQIEKTNLCQLCGAEVSDLATHKAMKH